MYSKLGDASGSDGLRSHRASRPMIFMQIADLYSSRATCQRASVGAVAVRDGRIVAAGYNGAPSGQAHCLDEGCIIVGGHCVRSAHAEANLISWAARVGTALGGTEMYSTSAPCLACAKLMRNAGIGGVAYRDTYDQSVEEATLINELGLYLEQYAPES